MSKAESFAGLPAPRKASFRPAQIEVKGKLISYPFSSFAGVAKRHEGLLKRAGNWWPELCFQLQRPGKRERTDIERVSSFPFLFGFRLKRIFPLTEFMRMIHRQTTPKSCCGCLRILTPHLCRTQWWFPERHNPRRALWNWQRLYQAHHWPHRKAVTPSNCVQQIMQKG